MPNKVRGLRINDEIFSFIREIHSDYAQNIGEFITDVFYFALHGVNPDNGNNIKQFFDDVRNGRWVNADSTAFKIRKAADGEYSAFSRFMSEYSDGDVGKEIIRDFIVSEQSPRLYWHSNLPRLTKYQKIILETYDVPIMKNDFIRYFSLWLNDPESLKVVDEVKVDVIGVLYEKHHPLDKYAEEES